MPARGRALGPATSGCLPLPEHGPCAFQKAGSTLGSVDENGEGECCWCFGTGSGERRKDRGQGRAGRAPGGGAAAGVRVRTPGRRQDTWVRGAEARLPSRHLSSGPATPSGVQKPRPHCSLDQSECATCPRHPGRRGLARPVLSEVLTPERFARCPGAESQAWATSTSGTGTPGPFIPQSPLLPKEPRLTLRAPVSLSECRRRAPGAVLLRSLLWPQEGGGDQGRESVLGPGRAAQWSEHHPAHQQAAGSILGQSSYPGCGFGPRSRQLQKATD